MNDRILALAEKCYTTKYNPFGADEELFDAVKFAELIIKECIDKIETYQIPAYRIRADPESDGFLRSRHELWNTRARDVLLYLCATHHVAHHVAGIHQWNRRP